MYEPIEWVDSNNAPIAEETQNTVEPEHKSSDVWRTIEKAATWQEEVQQTTSAEQGEITQDKIITPRQGPTTWNETEITCKNSKETTRVEQTTQQ